MMDFRFRLIFAFFVLRLGVVEGVCPTGWLQFGDQCYYFSDALFTWGEARSACQKRQGDLASAGTVSTRDFLTGVVTGSRFNDRNFWFGATDEENEGVWVWSDGTPWDNSIANWSPGQPDNWQGQENCAHLNGDGQWNDQPCWNELHYVCQRDEAILDKCNIEDGWRDYNGKCFKFVQTPGDWLGAEAYCLSNGGNLAVIDSQDKLRLVSDTITCADNSNNVWVGLSDRIVANTYVWVDRSPLTVTNWDTDQPQGIVDGQNCVEVVSLAGNKWHTALCSHKRKFICEKPEGQCAEGWIEAADGRCYQVNSLAMTRASWTDAVDYCALQGAGLITIENEVDQRMAQIIGGTLDDDNIGQMWIGISDRYQDNTFSWWDNTTVGYTNWDANQPGRAINRFDCGIMFTADPNGKWNTGYCFEKKAFICRMRLIDNIANSTLPPSLYRCDDEGWELFGEQCYWTSPTQKTWANAKQDCTDKSSIMLKIETPDQQSYISGSLRTMLWFGLNDQDTAGTWKWSDGTPLGDFKNFRPNFNDAGRCGILRSFSYSRSGEWQRNACGANRYYVCQKDATHLLYPPTTTAVPPTAPWTPLCGPNWKYDPLLQRCYQINPQPILPWSFARANCLDQGGDLVSINSRHESSFVLAMMFGVANQGSFKFWIGANDIDVEGGWGWSDGSPFNYHNWNSGEPNDWNGGEHCAETSANNFGAWNDYVCDNGCGFICEKEAMDATTPEPTSITAILCIDTALISGDRVVQDDLLQASSKQDDQHGPEFSRITEGNNACWSAAANSQNTMQWLEADFMVPTVIKSVATMGCVDKQEWVTKYKIVYKYDEDSKWITYQESQATAKIFNGNADQTTTITNTFEKPFVARWVRIMPTEWFHAMSLRWELNGCTAEECTSQALVSGAVMVSDSKLTASTVYGPDNTAAHARLNSASSWVATVNDDRQWIQADFAVELRVTEVWTQGRPDQMHWVTTYKLSFGKDGSAFMMYQQPMGQIKIFDGNTDQSTIKKNMIVSPFKARYMRIHPVSWYRMIAIRFEVKGCTIGCPLTALIDGPSPVEDYQLTASSQRDIYHGPQRSRLETVRDGDFRGAWTALYTDTQQYITVDLPYPVHIKGISTRGRQDSLEWVKSFKLQYNNGNSGPWSDYYEDGSVKVFDGNSDYNTIRTHFLGSPFIGTSVRLWPQTWERQISLRWEIHGCPGPQSSTYVGCFDDLDAVRDLPYEPIYEAPGGMTSRICINHCFEKGYSYAGVQAGTSCFCGNDFGRYGPSGTCTILCPGDNTFLCGGATANSIYTTGMAADGLRCPSGWSTNGDICYRAFNNTVEWDDAQSACATEGGDLATVNDASSNNYVLSMISEVGEDLWIGLSDKDYRHEFEWVDRTRVLYTNWNVGQPNGGGSEVAQCTTITAGNGRWNDEDCDQRFSYLCQKRKEALPTDQIPVTENVCGTGWVPWQTSCYSFFTSPLRTWQTASDTCTQLGASLVRIHDRYEQAFLSNQLSSTGLGYWTDLTDREIPGVYKWSDGNPNIPFTHWAPNQPDDRVGACVGMGTGSDAGLWFDRPCETPLSAICERLQPGLTTLVPPYTTPIDGTCPSGWKEYGNYCYEFNSYIINDQKTWTDAVDNCRHKNADLVSIWSQDEQTFVFENLPRTQENDFWIGLEANIDQGYTWTDGSPVLFTNWNDGEPNNHNGIEDCVEMLKDGVGKWNDNFCNERRNWICKARKDVDFATPATPVYPTAGPDGTCAPDNDNWKYYDGNCYFISDTVHDERLSWHESESRCQENGGHLLSIHSEQEERFIIGQLEIDYFGRDIWIGLNELDLQHGYRWSDKSPTDYINWNTNEPNDHDGAERCVVFLTRTGKWNDDLCSVINGYICKKRRGAPPVTPTPTPALPGYCPIGFYSFGNKCYKVFNDYDDRLPWDNARAQCQQNGVGFDLVSIGSDVEQAFVTTLLAGETTALWIGLKQLRGEFTWIDNHDVTYTNWNVGEPNGGSMEGCTEVLSENFNAGQWNDITCNHILGYICQSYKVAALSTPAPTPTSSCPADFVAFQDSCFHISTTPRTWDQANNYCKLKQANMASVNSRFDQAFVYSSIQTAGETWIGLTDIRTPGNFRWTDNWPVVYTNWGVNMPSGVGGCVKVMMDGTWIDGDCSQTLPVVCKTTTATPPYTPSPNEGQCRSRWTAFGSSCYLFGQTLSLLYSEAAFSCSRSGGDLLSITSDEENQFVYNHLTHSATSQSVWTGLFKSIDGNFQWPNGEAVSYTNWNDGEPSGTDGTAEENCVEIYAGSGKWNDVSCDVRRGFVCKMPQIYDSTPTSTTAVSTTTRRSTPTPTSRATTSTVPPRATTVRTTLGRLTSPTTTIEEGRTEGVITAPSGMPGGEVAAIVIGVIAAIALVIMAAFFIRNKMMNPSVKKTIENSFDNPMYTTNTDSVTVKTKDSQNI
ncbi:unnamed protein product [Owenia fusiformis]|uniref:Uncharacterized protein n=1 Tax=Owenia fusiformis TaxID=6347 RepID=A0A8J1TQH6_OWEFU|nr:unnamed protein product [Owenia fusiformis]